MILFDKTELVDARDGARALLGASLLEGDPWTRFLGFAGPRFPGIEEKLARIADAGRPTVAAASHHPMTVRVEWLGVITRITLTQHGRAQEEPTEGLTHQAMVEEIEALRSTMDRAPFLVSREHATGTVTWSTRAYLDLVTTLHPGAM